MVPITHFLRDVNQITNSVPEPSESVHTRRTQRGIFKRHISPQERTMEIIRPVAFLALLALFALTDSLIAQPAAISWPDAVGKIAGERAKAETCVALMKKYGDAAQNAR